ncbi:MAG: hypothetical protein K2G20_04885, partial [Lachnospiraceae bacterium]|nr:hypothetical protein [Lachnospiraceae bacterium]
MFHKIAGLLYDFLPKRKNGNVKVMEMLVQLYPNASESSLKRRYETGRLQKVLTILSVGSITAFTLWISGSNKGFLVNNRYILRAEQGGKEKSVLLTAKRENGEKIDTELTVRESRFQDGELETLYEDMLQEAVKTALDENDSWDNIHNDLQFMQQIDGYPFVLSWESGDYRYVTNSGRIAKWQEVKDLAQPSKLVPLTLRAEYYDFVREHIFYANICPASVETFDEKAANLLKQAEEENPYYDRVILPEVIEGEKVVWTERREHAGRNIFLLTLAVAFAVWILHD